MFAHIRFVYDEQKDMECLLSKGRGSLNSSQPTKTYQSLLERSPDLSEKNVIEFIRSIRGDKIQEIILKIQSSWDSINDEFQKRSAEVFGITLDGPITAYLTITGRYPYDVTEKYFYVPHNKENVNKTSMHELWHFYTEKKFGSQKSIVGEQIYNDIKEGLTVLLNPIFTDLLAGQADIGYPQHQKLRVKISEVWEKSKNIDEVWSTCCAFYSA